MDDANKVTEKIMVEVSSDQMSAFVTFEGPQNGGDKLGRNEIIKELEKFHIKKGIDKMVLAEVFSSSKMYGKKYLLASGKRAGTGKNGEVNLKFDVSNQGLKPVMKEDGTVDYKNLDNITLAKAGEVIAELVLPTKGEDGYTVQGEVIEGKEGKAVQLMRGKGTMISEDGMQLLAENNGRIIYADGKISISDVYEIKGDVGSATGNINFNGSVVVRGNVTTDFSIRATGNIEVFGIIEGAEIYAGGNVLVSKGISGVNKGLIQANGNVTSKSIQNAIIEAKGDVFAEAIMHSQVKTMGKIEVGGTKGLLVGGKIQCHNGVYAKVIGSPMGTKTEIHIGGDSNYLEEYNSTIAELHKLEENYKENLLHLDKMVQRRKKDERQGQENELSKASALHARNSLLNTINTTNTMKEHIDSLQEKIDSLKELVETDVSVAVLSVEGLTYPGLQLRIGNAKMLVEKEENRVKFRNSEGVVTVSPL